MSLIKAPSWQLDAPPDQKAGLAVCEAVAFGRSLSEIERDPAFPPRDLFISWVMRDPALALAYQRAREMSSYLLEDEALELLRARLSAPGSNAEIRALDLFVQQLRWSATKRNPGVFSEKANVNLTVPIQINTTLDMGGPGASTSAGGRTLPNVYELKAEVEREVALPSEADIRSPDLIEEAPPSKAPSPKYATGPRKRVLVPKARKAETAAQRDARLTAEALAEEAVLARAVKRRQARALREKKRRENASNPSS